MSFRPLPWPLAVGRQLVQARRNRLGQHGIDRGLHLPDERQSSAGLSALRGCFTGRPLL
jgi:hypothetical protein